MLEKRRGQRALDVVSPRHSWEHLCAPELWDETKTPRKIQKGHGSAMHALSDARYFGVFMC
jgi:predicted SAM-dependent methyltransferase